MQNYKLAGWSKAILSVTLMGLCIGVGGCGGGGSKSSSNNSLTREVTIAVMSGDDNAINDTNGAEGLTPVGAGVTVDIALETSDDDFNGRWKTLTTDSQGRVYLTMDQYPDQYIFFISNACSSALGLTLDSDGTLYKYPNDNFYNYHVASATLGAKATAATAATVASDADAVIVISSDASACENTNQ